LSLLSAEVVVWMTDGWPLYESRLKGKLHVISGVTLSALSDIT
jgi:insertion element IS1 protein InsB